MKPVKFLTAFLALSAIENAAHASVSDECKSYTDCDALVACELYGQVENAINGLPADYNGAVADAATYLHACNNYPDLFENNIDVMLSDDPAIRMAIDWSTVRARMRGGAQAGFTDSDQQLLSYIVNQVFGPDTKAQETFFTDLAAAYIAANKSDATARLDDAFVINFLGTGNNFEKYKSALVDLTGTDKDDELGIDVTWDDVLIEISNVQDTTNKMHGALVCENNRSWQVTIDGVGWAATAAAAVATFYAGGAGGTAVVAGKAAIGTGLKAAAKGMAKVGGKAAAKNMSKRGGKILAKTAIQLGLKANMRGYVNYAGRGVLKTGVKNYAKAVGANLLKKKTIAATAGALVYQVGGNLAKNSKSTKLYGLVSSDLNKDIVNCQGLDHNEGCYSVCGDANIGGDDLNTKALQPVLGKTYCVNPDDYALYEINANGTRGNIILMTNNQWKQIRTKIEQSVKDKGKCDWNEDDIDMYVGYYMYDPDTLEISDENMVIDDIIRLDD